jgi:hypothetical protein
MSVSPGVGQIEGLSIADNRDRFKTAAERDCPVLSTCNSRMRTGTQRVIYRMSQSGKLPQTDFNWSLIDFRLVTTERRTDDIRSQQLNDIRLRILSEVEARG